MKPLNKTYEYILGPVDTDSISFCKTDFSPFTEDEQELLIEEINNLLPNLIKYENDGYYKKCISIKAKNYILVKENGKITMKGSALKATQKEQALKIYIKDFINILINSESLEEAEPKVIKLYNDLIIKATKISNKDEMFEWCSRKTISQKTIKSERTNETKVIDALEGTNFTEGDRVYMFFKKDGSLSLRDNFDGDYDVDKLYEKIYSTTKTFGTLFNVKEKFINYKLKKNKELLRTLLNSEVSNG